MQHTTAQIDYTYLFRTATDTNTAVLVNPVFCIWHFVINITPYVLSCFGLWPNTFKTNDLPISLGYTLCLALISKC